MVQLTFFGFLRFYESVTLCVSTSAMDLYIQEKDEGLIFAVRVQPRSSRNQVAGLHADSLKINLTAPPVANAANKACSAFIAGLLSVAKSSVSIVSGHTGRNKRVMVRCPNDRAEREAIRKKILSLP